MTYIDSYVETIVLKIPFSNKKIGKEYFYFADILLSITTNNYMSKCINQGSPHGI